MSYGKRPRSEFEGNNSNGGNTSSFVTYGTALPPLDSHTRDDGSYVPVWKQEVTDERGRKRLHGAFTGGFSAGYFNTVGSKEGWTPSTFTSSRTSRATATAAKPEDFMDEEDLREQEEARELETNRNFSGLGGPEDGPSKPRTLMDLLMPAMQDTMGIKLLKKMGWKEGQGVGPKVMRKAKDFDGDNKLKGAEDKMHLFAPENTRMVSFLRKVGSKGLGYEGEAGLAVDKPTKQKAADDEEEDEGTSFGTLRKPVKPKKKTTAFGVGILNDDGEDDEDIYSIKPKSAYNRVIGGDKPKKKPALPKAAGLGKHVFVPKKVQAQKAYQTARKCHDGKLPLPGFILAEETVGAEGPRYPPPVVPDDWIAPDGSSATSTSSAAATPAALAEAANLAKLDPRQRGALLGEAPLPGKSVFDFLTPDARNRIANLTGKSHLPPGLGEAPVSTTRSTIADIVPHLDADTAMAALRGGFMPYGDDLEKRGRYRSFLEVKAGMKEGLPDRKYGMVTQDWVKEMNEFVGAARIFKPLTGAMATRFASAKTAASNFQGNTDAAIDTTTLITKPVEKEKDPQEEAARLGMHGRLTRSTIDFNPSRLLCKRFNVEYVGPVPGSDEYNKRSGESYRKAKEEEEVLALPPPPMRKQEKIVVDADKNEALEGEKAADEVFKNIFGDSDSDDED
ncbi:Similar to G patch domain-containing protein 1; acc. no. Q9DBM1 [Pyronema omphalodes CBS 100304]|uniref:Similar to G patch domain-containing protein 1 acc. no. Q9DBM1 n=1 Tax=Pyronema omphalodes (strain CBS 100304) TaxID=1076935 RepID=U4LUY7_PYROM|nr:Similar to G patch domain-containing protein 1; acc. no. Q9DBM1 [Pyronema omphalodes CBS 100304]